MTVILYARQSLDRTGEETAVERQLAESRAFAASRGITIDLELVDNDVSATSGVARPRFEEMLALKPTAIVAWHQDRLLRLTSDLERVIALDIPVYTANSGTLDLSTPAGRAVARTVAAWSQYEGEQKSIRQKAANQQRARAGVWQFSNRPYGYERVDGQVVIVEHEAEVIRKAVERYLAGETYYSITQDLNARGIPTISGGEWTITQLRERLANPAYAGIRVYKGEVYGDGDWQPIIDRETWERLASIKKRRKTAHGWSNKTKYLLSGLATCGVCGGTMFARPEYGRKQPDGSKSVRMTYQCTTNWCTSRDLSRVDALVEAVVLARLSRKDAREILTPTVDSEPLHVELDDLRGRRDDLAALLADGTLTASSVREQSAKLSARIEKLQTELHAAEGRSEFGPLIGAADITTKWAALTLAAKRRILASLLTVAVHKQASTRGFDPDAVKIEWR